MKAIVISSLPTALLQNHLQAQIIDNVSQIFHIAQTNDLEELYISLSLINDTLLRCSKKYGFRIFGIYDNDDVCPVTILNNEITIIGIGGKTTKEWIENLPYKCDRIVLDKIKYLDEQPMWDKFSLRDLYSQKAMLYHYGNKTDEHLLECVQNVEQLYTFGLHSVHYPLPNNFGVLNLNSFRKFSGEITYLICFDPMQLGLTPPQIYLSRNMLCLCDARCDVESIAPFPTFSNQSELQALLKKYRSDFELTKEKIHEIDQILYYEN